MQSEFCSFESIILNWFISSYFVTMSLLCRRILTCSFVKLQLISTTTISFLVQF